MKPFTYQPTSSDIEVMYFVLSATTELLDILSMDDFDISAKANQKKYSSSAAHRLETLSTQISFNELLTIYNALVIADRITHKEITVPDEIYKPFAKYTLSIVKLLSVFEKYLDE